MLNEKKIENDYIMFWEMTMESKLLDQFQWYWYHSSQKTMFYLIKYKKKLYFRIGLSK